MALSWKQNEKGNFTCRFAGGHATVYASGSPSKWGYFVNGHKGDLVAYKQSPKYQTAEEAMGLAAKDIAELVNATLIGMRQRRDALAKAQAEAYSKVFAGDGKPWAGGPVDVGDLIDKTIGIDKAIDLNGWSEESIEMAGSLPWAFVEKKFRKRAKWPFGRIWSVSGQRGVFVAHNSQKDGGIECFCPMHNRPAGRGALVRLRQVDEAELHGILFPE